MFQKTFQFWLELRMALWITPFAQESKPILGDKYEPLSCDLTRLERGIHPARLLDPMVGCSHDLKVGDRYSLPYVHPLCNTKQKPVDLSERGVTMTAFAQITKKSTPLLGEAAGLIKTYPITAFH